MILNIMNPTSHYLSVSKMTVPKKVTAGNAVSKSLDKLEKILSRPVVFVIIIISTAVLFAVNLFLTGLAGNPEMSRGKEAFYITFL